MRQPDMMFETARTAATRLPRGLQRRLIQELTTATPDQDRTIAFLRRLPADKQRRLTSLMERNNERQLGPAERAALKRLGQEADRITLANSKALARALRPELFDRRGKPIMRRVRRAARARLASFKASRGRHGR